MTDKEIQSLINILQEAKWSSKSFKKARLMDCYNDLQWILKIEIPLYEVSDWDNTYRIPYNLLEEFEKNSTNPHKEHSDEWYEWCCEFDNKWGNYQV